MDATPFERPIDRVLAVLSHVKGPNSSEWYQSSCPGPRHKHGDKSRSLSFKEIGEGDNNGVAFTCFTGCSRQEILDGLNLTEEEMHVSTKNGRYRTFAKNATLTAFDLGVHKLINPNYLLTLGVVDGECTFHTQDGKPYQKKGIVIPYHSPDGKPYERYRLRTQLIAKKGTVWNEDDKNHPKPIIPYGLHQLDMARQAGYLILAEGESDCWTLWLHHLPALGIPGANMAGCLMLNYLDGIDCIYVIQEPGPAGQNFPKEVKKRLDTLGYKGKVYAIDLANHTGAKDPNDLHKRDVNAFKSTFENAMSHAQPLFPVASKPTVYRLRDLQQETLPETKWAIEPILPEGATILAGKPKIGKSLFALALQHAIASGDVALGRYPVERGEVLYISLEDHKKRLQKRTNILLHNTLASEDFYYCTVYPRINEGGLELLEEWIVEHPRARLICIDPWARFKPRIRGRQPSQYDEDYEAIAPLHELAAKHGVALLIVDHMRKLGSDDPLDMVISSTGKTGAADGFLLLYRKRGEADARLLVIGRDIEEEQELILTFNQACASWVVKGDAEETFIATTPVRQAILDELIKHADGLTVRELADHLGKNINTTRNLLKSLRDENRVKLEQNKYSVVSSSKDSKGSNSGKHSNPPESNLELTLSDHIPSTVVTMPVVTPSNPVQEPVEAMQTPQKLHITTVTTPTTHHALPRWLVPGTKDWKKLVERVGIQEANDRRSIALAQMRGTVS